MADVFCYHHAVISNCCSPYKEVEILDRSSLAAQHYFLT